MAAAGAISQLFKQSMRPAARAAIAKKPDCFATVTATLNNTHVCFARLNGEVIAHTSAGMTGRKGPQRQEGDGAREAARRAAAKAVAAGHRIAHLRFKGRSRGRSAALQGVMSADMKISHLEDITAFPTNGCRARKARRL